ncbi:MAG: right-handed parallel beta-helix repeat-containing protein, partial [Clostridia bacterium]|nr:right-handed parallel beta-helix repeat-containing protein [Clostridia bacterium]
AVYHVRPEDSFALTGYYCTNTAAKDENPDGGRNVAVFLKDIRDVTIDGNGAVILIHGKMTPFLFDNCVNITVRDLTVDYACPTMTEFTVMSSENGVCELRFLPECLFRVDGNRLFFRGETGPDGLPYWEDESCGDHRFAKIYDPGSDTYGDYNKNLLSFSSIEQTGERILRVVFAEAGAAPRAGQSVQTRNIIRDQTGALFQRCRDLRFEDLRIKFMHGLGMTAQFCENVSYLNCDFTPGEGRRIASTADFFQFSGCRGRILIENCRARGAQDDYVNVHGTHLRIIGIDPDTRSMTVRFMHKETWGIQAFAPGDRLEFIRRETLLPYVETVVAAYEKLNDTDILLRLDRPLPESVIPGEDVVENATWTPDLTVRGCDFGATWGRGVLCTTRGRVVIENNRFCHLSAPVLVVEDDCNFWFESGYTRDITFRNNEVTGCNCGGSYDGAAICFAPKILRHTDGEYVHGRLTVTGNTFREAFGGQHLISLESVGEAEITGNYSDAPLAVSSGYCGTVHECDNILI